MSCCFYFKFINHYLFILQVKEIAQGQVEVHTLQTSEVGGAVAEEETLHVRDNIMCI
jgi:hypothetical protein